MTARAIISAQSEEHGDNRDEITPESVEGGQVKIAFNSTLLAGSADRAEPQQGGAGDHEFHRAGEY